MTNQLLVKVAPHLAFSDSCFCSLIRTNIEGFSLWHIVESLHAIAGCNQALGYCVSSAKLSMVDSWHEKLH